MGKEGGGVLTLLSDILYLFVVVAMFNIDLGKAKMTTKWHLIHFISLYSLEKYLIEFE